MLVSAEERLWREWWGADLRPRARAAATDARRWHALGIRQDHEAAHSVVRGMRALRTGESKKQAA